MRNRLMSLLTIAACLLACLWAKSADARDRLRDRVHPCLAAIVDRENPNWNPRLYNYAGSGAYGLPQALPASKMASAGADWRTNPITQLRWMARYVDARYGSACAALAFHKRNGWY